MSVRIKRSNGFEGRIPISVQKLPFDLSVPDIGLNGILIDEKEESSRVLDSSGTECSAFRTDDLSDCPGRDQLAAGVRARFDADQVEGRQQADCGRSITRAANVDWLPF